MGYYHTSIEVWYSSTDPLAYQQCDGSGEDWACYYVGYSIDDHLNYFGLYEDCPSTHYAANTTKNDVMDISSTMVLSMESTDVSSDDDMFENTTIDELETVVESLDIVYV